jgi:HNH endonuclease
MKKIKLSDLDLYSFGNEVQMTGVIFSGKGETHLCFFPASKDDFVHSVLEMDLDEWKKLMLQVDVMETEILTQSPGGELTKTIVRKSQRAIDQGCTWRVFKRDQFRCRYCGADDTPLTVDHLVCWESGGPSIEDNLLSSCRKDNKTRGNLPYDQWLEHPHYLRVSQNLTPAQRQANADLVSSLARIPRLYHKRSR